MPAHLIEHTINELAPSLTVAAERGELTTAKLNEIISAELGDDLMPHARQILAALKNHGITPHGNTWRLTEG